MSTPAEALMDLVKWEPIEGADEVVDDGTPYATHMGVLRLGDFELRCYQLNTGERVFNADDVAGYFTDGTEG